VTGPLSARGVLDSGFLGNVKGDMGVLPCPSVREISS